jgi:hypothetical protein
MAYSIVLSIHSLLRWLVLGFLIAALVQAFQARGGAYLPKHKKLSTFFMASLHTNVVLGIVMYGVLSPTTQLAFADMAMAMKTSALRFFLIEHPIGQLAAVVVATLGSAKIKRAATDADKHSKTLVFYGTTLLLILASIPWPFYRAGRPLLPF